ncbi:hypothetical protein RhiirA5_461520 [Rhizophagus irregularis]|uniref:Cytochrome P450 n=1 Tax=Rhizophagus irregularis TaxID=588596 RepID=A0A2N0NY75_9GLOM|nr:hypothetical protein RhiirA5_461520 [Rhizophagus irregularis]
MAKAFIEDQDVRRQNTPLDKPLTNDLLTLCGIKINDKEVMRPMTDSEICGIIFNGIIDGTDTEVINGPAETIIRINIDAIHNNEEYWEELNKFNPDKWMVKGFEPKKNSFIIFGGGLRVCPGRKLSKIELILN